MSLGKLSFTASLLKNMVMTDSAKLYSLPYKSSPSLETNQKVWNLTEEGAIKSIVGMFHQSVKTKKKFYIPADGSCPEGFNIFKPD